MEQRFSLISLGVSDLAVSRRFYVEMLGWKPAFDSPEIVFFDMGGYMLGLYAHLSLAKDIGVPPGDGAVAPYQGFTLAQNLRSIAEVDALFAELKTKRVKILKEPQKVFWGGYSGYFADPDGHAWEVAFNPNWDIDEAGRIVRK